MVTLVMACMFMGGWGVIQFAKWRHAVNYPYGQSHCCDKILSLALYNFASIHGGVFPTGEATPEASLSLLYKAGFVDANTLRGKSVPETTVQEILDRGELLGPDSCGWHYVEGLRTDSDRRFALFWDKAGLGHNGELLRDGGHIVCFVYGDTRHIPASEWPKFLADQKELHDQLEKKNAEAKTNDLEEKH